MNFSAVPPDALDATSATTRPTSPLAAAPPAAAPPPPPPPPPPRRDDQPERIHYTNEFHVYRKARANGNGITKRARCNHCNGDWAYNETRLKHHIIDAYRGCRRVPPEIRERIRAADAQNSASAAAAAVASSAAAVAAAAHAAHATPVLGAHISPHQPLPPAKRKREATLSAAIARASSSSPLRGGAVVALSGDSTVGAQLCGAAAAAHEVHVNGAGANGSGAGATAEDTHVRVAVEFSMTSGGLLRATWIASELISEFHREILDVGLIPRTAENTFNIWIGGKIAWSRGVGQPLPDYDHLRPIIRNQCCQAPTV